MKKLSLCFLFQEYLGFILAIGEAIRGKKIRDPDIQESEIVKRLIILLVIQFSQ